MQFPHKQRIFENLRSRFGTAGTEGSGPAAAPPGALLFPDSILEVGLHECLGQGPGDWPSALAFALSAAARSGGSNRTIFILNLKSSLQELGELYGHGLAGFGVDPAQVIPIGVKTEKDLLWAVEEIAASPTGTVIAMLDAKEKLYGFTASRRLKLRAEGAGSLVVVLRHWSQEGATAAHTRWRIARGPGTPEVKIPGSTLVGAPRLVARLERGQGCPSSQWEMAYHASAGFRVAPLLADGAPRMEQPFRQVA
jgi:protein ImuA